MLVRKGSDVRFQNQGNNNNKVRVRDVSVGWSIDRSFHLLQRECEREREPWAPRTEQNGGPIRNERAPQEKFSIGAISHRHDKPEIQYNIYSFDSIRFDLSAPSDE